MSEEEELVRRCEKGEHGTSSPTGETRLMRSSDIAARLGSGDEEDSVSEAIMGGETLAGLCPLPSPDHSSSSQRPRLNHAARMCTQEGFGGKASKY